MPAARMASFWIFALSPNDKGGASNSVWFYENHVWNTLSVFQGITKEAGNFDMKYSAFIETPKACYLSS